MLIYHKQLLKNGTELGEEKRFFIDTTDSYYRSRHLLKNTFDFYKFYHKNPSDIKFLLLNPVNENSDSFLQITKRQNIMKNKNFILVSKKLIFDAKKEKLKTGHDKLIARLIHLWQQYERTFDLYSMPYKQIIKLINKKDTYLRVNFAEP